MIREKSLAGGKKNESGAYLQLWKGLLTTSSIPKATPNSSLASRRLGSPLPEAFRGSQKMPGTLRQTTKLSTSLNLWKRG
jgi:hypothetical protein